MGSVRRNAAGPAKFSVHCVIAALLGIGSSGCSGLGSFRSTDYPLFGGFWDYGKAAEIAPGGDVYAQQLTEARNRAAERQARAAQAKPAKAQGEGDADKPDDNAPKLVPPGDPAKPNGPAKPADPKPPASVSRARNNDANTIRVTLGRPESLPTIDGLPRSGSTSTAIAKSSGGWKREGADERSLAGGDPRAPETESARVASRNVEEAAEGQGNDLMLATRDPRPAQKSRKRVAPRASAEPAEETPPAVSTRTNEEEKDEILGRAKARLRSLSNYQVEMSRVERVGGLLQPNEEVLLSIRRAPKAVRIQWDSGPNKGREVIYSTSLDDKVIHVNMANSAFPLPRMSIPVDSPLIMRNSRHSIREAGFDTILEHMSDATSGSDSKGSSGGKVTYGGLIKSDAEDGLCHRFIRIAPNGERWEVLLDERSLMPRSVVAKDARGELLERYTYRQLKENPVELSAADSFDPDSRWGKSKGLFSRLAGAAAGNLGGSGSSATTR